MDKDIKFAFKKSIPVMFGYLFLGSAIGIMLQEKGYGVIWALVAGLTVYAGSGEFLLVNLLSTKATLIETFIMTFLINSRHIFYGLSFIEKFKSMGKYYPYMIFSLTDETYSVLSTNKYPKDIDENKAMFYISLFHHVYWVLGGIIGSLLGKIIPIDMYGIDFTMTALFVVLFMEQWENSKSKIPIYIGFISSIVFFIVLGKNFLLPSLIFTVGFLLIFKNKIENDMEMILND